jgi:hypothetical protein
MDDGRDIALEPDTSEQRRSDAIGDGAWTELFAEWFAEQSELLIRELERDTKRG